jgi:hypothetical protein
LASLRSQPKRRIDPDIKKFFNAAIKSMTTPGRQETMNKLTISDGWLGERARLPLIWLLAAL